jgi:hypothetical protein
MEAESFAALAVIWDAPPVRTPGLAAYGVVNVRSSPRVVPAAFVAVTR